MKTLSRILVFIFSLVGLILCLVALVLPFWIYITTGGYSGDQGLFMSCIDNYGGGKECSSQLFFNGNGYSRVYQAFMCIGLAFYCIFVMLAAMVFFWTTNEKGKKRIKLSACAFALLTVVFLLVAILTFVGNHRDDSSTLSFGWYLAVVSLVLAGIASPLYAVDAYTTTKMKKQILNVAPRPTIITEYQRQRMIDGFSSQIYKQRSELPSPLGLRQNMSKLYDNLEQNNPPQRNVTTTVGDVDDLEVMGTTQKKPFIPASSEYKYESMYEFETFVHPPPKLISADISIKNIFKKNLMANLGYESDTSSIPSRYSLESGQLDDNDLEVFHITKDYRSNNGSEDEKQQSREAFGTKKLKKNHTSAIKIIDGRTISKMEHEELPTISVIGPDLESHDYKDPIHLTSSSTLTQKEGQITLPSEADIKTHRPDRSRKKSSSRLQNSLDNEAVAKSDAAIYFGALSPSNGQGQIDKEQPSSNVKDDNEQERAKHKKKSGKHKKRKRKQSHDKIDKEETVAAKTKDKQKNDFQIVIAEAENSTVKHRKHKRARSRDKGIKDEPVGESTISVKERDRRKDVEIALKRRDEKRSSKHKKHKYKYDKTKNPLRNDNDDDGDIMSTMTEVKQCEEISTNDETIIERIDEQRSSMLKNHKTDQSENANVEMEDSIQIHILSQNNKHKREKEQESDDGTAFEGGSQLNVSRRHSRKGKKHKQEKQDGVLDENTKQLGVNGQRRSSKAKLKSKPYIGSDLEYDRVSGYGSDMGDGNRVRNEKEGTSKNVETRTESAENFRNDIDEILKIPVNSANENTKL